MNAHPYDAPERMPEPRSWGDPTGNPKLERLLDLCDELQHLYGGFVAVRILVDEPPYVAGRDLSDNPRLYSVQFMEPTR